MCSCGCNNCSSYDGGCGCSSFDGDDTIGLGYDGFSLKGLSTKVFGTKEDRMYNKGKRIEKRVSKLPTEDEYEAEQKDKSDKKAQRKAKIKDIITKFGSGEKAQSLISELNPSSDEVQEVSQETNTDLSNVSTSDDNTMLYLGIGGGILALIIIYFVVIK